MVICNSCQGAIGTRKKDAVFCGPCSRHFHASCVSLRAEHLTLISELNGLEWKCDDCVNSCVTILQSQLNGFIEKKVSDALSTLTTAFEALKSDLLKVIGDNAVGSLQESALLQMKYADVVSNKAQPAVIIKPKNANQPNSQTKQDIAREVDPVTADISLSRVKHVKNGGLLVGCAGKGDHDKFVDLVREKLSDNYEVKVFQGLQPRVRIAGISEDYDQESFLNYVRKLNPNVFRGDSDCKLINFSATKRNKDVYQAVMQVDRGTYDRIMKVGNVFVGYDSCQVYDAISVLRCFKCNDFGHVSKYCSGLQICPRCTENHAVKDCKSNTLKCSNCCKLRDKIADCSIDHAAWDVGKCHSYLAACDKLRQDLFIHTSK